MASVALLMYFFGAAEDPGTSGDGYGQGSDDTGGRGRNQVMLTEIELDEFSSWLMS